MKKTHPKFHWKKVKCQSLRCDSMYFLCLCLRCTSSSTSCVCADVTCLSAKCLWKMNKGVFFFPKWNETIGCYPPTNRTICLKLPQLNVVHKCPHTLTWTMMFCLLTAVHIETLTLQHEHIFMSFQMQHRLAKAPGSHRACKVAGQLQNNLWKTYGDERKKPRGHKSCCWSAKTWEEFILSETGKSCSVDSTTVLIGNADY